MVKEQSEGNDQLNGDIASGSFSGFECQLTSILSREQLESLNEQNDNLLSCEELETIRQELIQIAERLYQKNNSHKPILVVSDGTYLSLKQKLFSKIFGEDLYRKYVNFVKIKYDSKGVDVEELEKYQPKFFGNIMR